MKSPIIIPLLDYRRNHAEKTFSNQIQIISSHTNEARVPVFRTKNGNFFVVMLHDPASFFISSRLHSSRCFLALVAYLILHLLLFRPQYGPIPPSFYGHLQPASSGGRTRRLQVQTAPAFDQETLETSRGNQLHHIRTMDKV